MQFNKDIPPTTDPRIPDDVLDDLVWQMTHPAAIVRMSKATLRALLMAYGRELERDHEAA